MSRSLTAAVLLFASAAAGHAAVATYDFEALAVDAVTPLTITSNGLGATFAGPPGVDPGAFGLGFNSAGGPLGAPYRTLSGAFLTVGPAFGAIGSPLTVSFSLPVTAVSLQFALDDTGGGSALTLTTSGGGSATAAGSVAAGFRYPEGTLSYSGAAFTALTLRSTAPDFQVDGVSVTFAAAVPEPVSLGLLGAGLLAVAGVRRRRA